LRLLKVKHLLDGRRPLNSYKLMLQVVTVRQRSNTVDTNV